MYSHFFTNKYIICTFYVSKEQDILSTFTNGETWMAIPTSKVEVGRTGRPSVAKLNVGKITTSHVFEEPNLYTTLATRPEKGSGFWSKSLLPNSNT